MNEKENTIEEVVENFDDTEEVFEDTNEMIEDSVETSKELTSTSKKEKKHIQAKKLIEEAKSIVSASDEEMQDCRLLLEDDLRAYNDAKRALHQGGYDEAKTLLNELGDGELGEELEEDNVVFEVDDAVEPIVLKDVSSGKFTGFILSLLAGLSTFLGLIYLATKKLGITVDTTKKPSDETIASIGNWFSSLVGVENNPTLGLGLLAFASLLVMIIVYVIRVGTKGNSNLRFANKQMKDTQKYITQKNICKIEMDRVDEHITDAIGTLGDYQILLNEESGKLKRILHFEGKHAKLDAYHTKSVQTMEDTQSLVESIGEFMATPMSEEGKLSERSVIFLQNAKDSLQEILTKLS